jgi:hypothetical protein
VHASLGQRLPGRRHHRSLLRHGRVPQPVLEHLRRPRRAPSSRSTISAAP